jgi:hypothetical protein
LKLNLNTILFVLGGLGLFAPDVASAAAWLAAMHIAWLVLPVKILAFLATAFAAAPLIVPRLRAFLALFGLATPPGAQAPWIPGKDANVIPIAQMREQPQGAPMFPTSAEDAKTPVLPRGIVLKSTLPPRDPTA